VVDSATSSLVDTSFKFWRRIFVTLIDEEASSESLYSFSKYVENGNVASLYTMPLECLLGCS